MADETDDVSDDRVTVLLPEIKSSEYQLLKVRTCQARLHEPVGAEVSDPEFGRRGPEGAVRVRLVVLAHQPFHEHSVRIERKSVTVYGQIRHSLERIDEVPGVEIDGDDGGGLEGPDRVLSGPGGVAMHE